MTGEERPWSFGDGQVVDHVMVTTLSRARCTICGATIAIGQSDGLGDIVEAIDTFARRHLHGKPTYPIDE